MRNIRRCARTMLLTHAHINVQTFAEEQFAFAGVVRYGVLAEKGMGLKGKLAGQILGPRPGLAIVSFFGGRVEIILRLLAVLVGRANSYSLYSLSPSPSP